MAKKSIEDLIENLAISTQNQFQHLEGKMDKLGEKMGTLEEKMDKRFDRLEFLMTGHEQRISILEDKVRQISVKVGFR